MNAPTPSWKPSRHTWACTSSRSASHRSTGPVRPCSSTIRTPRSNATHAITFEWVKWRRGPRTSQIPSSGSRQTRLEELEQAPAERPGVVQRRQARRARLVERVEDLAVDVELELRARRVADADGPRPLVALEPRQLELGDAAAPRRARTATAARRASRRSRGGASRAMRSPRRRSRRGSARGG